ncbi:MAG: hypothetical protein RR319_09350 [Bacteroides sp.]
MEKISKMRVEDSKRFLHDICKEDYLDYVAERFNDIMAVLLSSTNEVKIGDTENVNRHVEMLTILNLNINALRFIAETRNSDK